MNPVPSQLFENVAKYTFIQLSARLSVEAACMMFLVLCFGQFFCTFDKEPAPECAVSVVDTLVWLHDNNLLSLYHRGKPAKYLAAFWPLAR